MKPYHFCLESSSDWFVHIETFKYYVGVIF